MKFSIIVPIYNVERYLAQCVESVLSQDYDEFEVILVDDGSPDGCPAICDDYALKDDRVIVVHKENGGLSDARNTGIKVATGDYVCFLDSDDYWDDKSALSKMAKTLKEFNADAVQYYHRWYKEKEQEFLPIQKRGMSRLNGNDTVKIIKTAVQESNLSISACSMAISRSFIIENNLYFEKGIKTEDLEWAIRLFVCKPMWSYLDDVFYVYRMDRDDSITGTVDYKHLCDYCYILEKSVALVEKRANDIKEALLSYLMYHVLIASALCYRVKLTNVQRKEILTRLRNVCKGRISIYCIEPKVNLAKKIYKIFGFSVMAKAVGFYLNHRKK